MASPGRKTVYQQQYSPVVHDACDRLDRSQPVLLCWVIDLLRQQKLPKCCAGCSEPGYFGARGRQGARFLMI